MTTITKADRTAADRLLNAAVREAIPLARRGEDPAPLLAVATAAAGLLLDPEEREIKTSQPIRPGRQEGDKDGNKGGVHPDRTRQVAEGPDGRGLHGGSGVLAGAGSGPASGRAQGADWQRGLTESGARDSDPGTAERPYPPGMPTDPNPGRDALEPPRPDRPGQP